jgi:hypothetical protein
MMKNDQEFPDDFQFKPLTEGLGFHPKKQEPKTMPMPQPVTMKASILDTPLPRPRSIETPKLTPATQAVDGLLKTLQDKNKTLKFDDKSKAQSPYVHTYPSLAAGFLDTLLIISLSLFYMMAMTFTLKMDIIRLLADGSSEILLATAGLFLGVGFTYYMAQRLILGFTIGEWAYEQRLGLPEEFKNGYSLRVLLRLGLHIISGVIVIPLISWALERDLAGISGLSTYKRR